MSEVFVTCYGSLRLLKTKFMSAAPFQT